MDDDADDDLWEKKLNEFYQSVRDNSQPKILTDVSVILYDEYDEYDKKLFARFKRGDKAALIEMIFHCAGRREISSWALSALAVASYRYYYGELKSWDDIFGKPWPGKSRKTAWLNSPECALCVWVEVSLLKDKGHATDEALFNRVGKKLKIGHKSTVSRIYYKMENERQQRAARCQK
jgi:hypothetical protein